MRRSESTAATVLKGSVRGPERAVTETTAKERRNHHAGLTEKQTHIVLMKKQLKKE